MAGKRVAIYVSPDTIFTYETKDKMKGKLRIISNCALQFPEGFEITVGKNNYVVVKNFIKDVNDIPVIKLSDHLDYVL